MGDRFSRVIDKAIAATLSTGLCDAAVDIVRELQAPANVDALLAGNASPRDCDGASGGAPGTPIGCS